MVEVPVAVVLVELPGGVGRNPDPLRPEEVPEVADVVEHGHGGPRGHTLSGWPSADESLSRILRIGSPIYDRSVSMHSVRHSGNTTAHHCTPQPLSATTGRSAGTPLSPHHQKTHHTSPVDRRQWSAALSLCSTGYRPWARSVRAPQHCSPTNTAVIALTVSACQCMCMAWHGMPNGVRRVAVRFMCTSSWWKGVPPR